MCICTPACEKFICDNLARGNTINTLVLLMCMYSNWQ